PCASIESYSRRDNCRRADRHTAELPFRVPRPVECAEPTELHFRSATPMSRPDYLCATTGIRPELRPWPGMRHARHSHPAGGFAVNNLRFEHESAISTRPDSWRRTDLASIRPTDDGPPDTY